jgi:hypothetical protein
MVLKARTIWPGLGCQAQRTNSGLSFSARSKRTGSDVYVRFKAAKYPLGIVGGFCLKKDTKMLRIAGALASVGVSFATALLGDRGKM